MRNENGFGSIICLDKTGKKRRKPWAVRITTGWKDGKQQRKYLGYYRTQSDALVALAEYHKNNVSLDVSKLTLNEVYDRWIERVAQKDLSASVMKTHNIAKSRFGKLGDSPMKDIKSIHLQSWFDDIELKPNSKRKIKSTMSQVYKYALNNDIVNKNYAESLEINEKVEQVGSVFTAKEIGVLWKHKDDYYVRLLLILIYTGLRISELLKIEMKNLHLDESYMIGGLKTEAGIDRIIPLHDKILPLVKELAEGNKKWLCESRANSHTAYTTVRNKVDELMQKFNMEHKIHDTRRTCVSLLHSANIPMETIRKIVGHSGQGVTEKVYLFKNPKELVEAINKVEINY